MTLCLFKCWRLRSNLNEDTAAPLRSLRLLPRRWPVAKGADKELVDAKTKVCDLVIESLTLSSPREEERGRERLEDSPTTKMGQTAMLMGTSI